MRQKSKDAQVIRATQNGDQLREQRNLLAHSSKVEVNQLDFSTRVNTEEENFLRLVRIILRDVPSKLRSLFKSQFASKCGMQYADNTASGNFFLNSVRHKSKDAQVISVTQNGDQLRQQRNLLAHSSKAEVNQLDFSTRVNKLIGMYSVLLFAVLRCTAAAN